MPEGISFVESLLELERLKYQQNENPVFVWRALHICGGCIDGNKHPIPEWCQKYLFDAAEGVGALLKPPIDVRQEADGSVSSSLGRWSKGKTWTPVVAEIPRVLGFTREAWNAFKDAIRTEEDLRLAVQHKALTEGLHLKSGEANDQLLSEIGAEDESALGKRLAKGRKLMAPKKPAKPKG